MNFFEQQRRARQNTSVLVVLFLIAVIGISSITGVMLTYLLNLKTHFNYDKSFENFKIISMMVFSIITIVTLLKIFFKSRGDEIAIKLGGVLVPQNTSDPKQRQLLNIVEEMAIASGIPIPATYILQDDLTINAFAAGANAFTAVIGVNRGTLIALDRSELQAVIGHEFSHILNNDIKLNMQTTAAIGGLMFIANLGQYLMSTRSRNYSRSESSRSESISVSLVGLVIFIFGSLGVLVSRMIQALISQQREFLADASSVQFTRNHEAMAKALIKIKYISGSSIDNYLNFELNHMFFSSAIENSFFSSIFHTHPPLEERIKRIAPNFNVDDYLKSISSDSKVKEHNTELEKHRMIYSTKSFSSTERTKDLSSLTSKPNPPLFQSISQPTADHLDVSISLLQGLPIEIVEATRDLSQSKIIILTSILFFQSKEVQQKIINEISNQTAEDRQFVQSILILLQENLKYHIPLLSLSLKTLKALDKSEMEEFINQLKVIFLADREFSFFEMITLLLIESTLNPSTLLKETSENRVVHLKIEIENLLYWYFTNGRIESNQVLDEQSKKKFYNIISSLLPEANTWGRQAALSYTLLKEILGKLKLLRPQEKRKLIQTLFYSIANPDTSSVENFEKIRILCAILEVPVPPIQN